MVLWRLLWWLLLLYILALLARAILGWVSVFSRNWRPRGAALVFAEAVYTVTDPPLRAIRRVIPPLRLGAVLLDLGFSILFLACFVAWSIVGAQL